MRILYNSKDTSFKTPFGTLTEGQKCSISIHIPASCQSVRVRLVFLREDHGHYADFEMKKSGAYDAYEIFSCDFALNENDLYFYYFHITTKNEAFSLYRQGFDMTNMEAGELWQLSVIPEGFTVPREYAGAVMYQIFPDRFNKSGALDLAGKLEPYWMHENWNDIPCYLPDESGEVRNCDFFGGNLRGIAEKLGYLSALGVGVIYLNPIFKAYSNHRYDTADYLKIDEALGTEDDFKCFCEEAHAHGIKVILDGVFSHTGSNSRYFDIENIFGGGAYHDPASKYRVWFDFKHYPDDYTSWWGIETLPCTNENEKSFRDFIINSENGVISHWIRAGADGFRLDVADELPDSFIMEFRTKLKQIKPDAILIGEVWEDASNKISYDKRRRYFTDGELDSVMNYPWRSAIVDFVTGADDGTRFVQTVMEIAENYPTEVVSVLMNMLSTHDTVRILSLLSPENAPYTKNERASYRMGEQAKKEAISRLMAACVLQFALPGMPCIYYGDEIGTEGFEDPFCRSAFDWSRAENNDLLDFFTSLCSVRNNRDALKYGYLRAQKYGDSLVCIERGIGESICRAYVNAGEDSAVSIKGRVILSRGLIMCEGEYRLKKYGFLIEE